MKTCLICGKSFPFKMMIDGKIRHLGGRKFCIECSPFGKHNTKSLNLTEKEKMDRRVRWNRHYVSDEVKAEILNLYKDGLSYNDIQKKIKVSYQTIANMVKGIRTLKDAAILARANGKCKLSEAGRLKLSENGKRAVKSGNKVWTKPEREFKKILSEERIGVKFPEIIKETLGLVDDDHATVFFQYPFQRYLCDFYDAEFNVIYQINGDFWHANPLLYNHDHLTKIQQNNIRHDKNRKVFFDKRGIKILDIWESEIYWNKDLVKNKIREVRKQVNPPVLHTGIDGSVTHTSHHNDLEWNDMVRRLWFKTDRPKRIKRPPVKVVCSNYLCRKEFETPNKDKKTRKYCCDECRTLGVRKVIRPSLQELKELMFTMPMIKIAKKYGVCDRAVAKWARAYKIDMPQLNMRGYWQKQQAKNNASAE